MTERPRCPEQRRPRVYISGPMTIGDWEANIRVAEAAALELIQAGFAVLCPQLTGRMTGHETIGHDEWIANDLPWVEVADAVLRLSGVSAGGDRECRAATFCSVPIYYYDTGWGQLLQDRDKLIKGIVVDSEKIIDPAFDAILDDIRELHERKAADYGRDEDPLANVRAAEDYGIEPWIGVEIRLNDKQRRIQRFVQKGELRNESVEDSLIDRIVYSIISLQLYREGK